MKKLFFIFFLTMSACDSPMNNRLNDSPNNAEKTNSLPSESLKLHLKTRWLVGPVGSINVNNTLLVSIYNEQGELTDLPTGLHLQFYATMPSMGHPMDDAGIFEKIATGLYLNSTIKYNMPGDWQNELWVMDANFQISEKVKWLEFF